MMKLELDWAGEGPAPVGPVDEPGDGVTMVVEEGQAKGPAGWPTIVVWVSVEAGVEAWKGSQALVGWLNDEYTGGDWEMADELGAMAEEA